MVGRQNNFIEAELTEIETEIWPHVRGGHKNGKENESDTSKAHMLEVYPA